MRVSKKLLFLLALTACGSGGGETSLPPEKFASIYKSTISAVLVDVRTEAEVKEGALENAENIVYDEAFAGKLSHLSKDAPVFVYCAAGKRSAKAADIMKQQGFKKVYQLQGGLNAWRQAGLPLEGLH